MWISLDAWGQPDIIGADTRGLHGTVEEDMYFARIGGADDWDEQTTAELDPILFEHRDRMYAKHSALPLSL